MENQAFIDGQNLYINTASNHWSVDLTRLRIYLKEKYHVKNVYYFIGIKDSSHQNLYRQIKKAGFILVFREHSQSMQGRKKGNVDTDIVFTILSKLIDHEKMDKVILISGDGDYYKMVKYLIEKDKFCKLLSPNRRSTSSLYRKLSPKFIDYLDNPDIKRKITAQQKTGSS